MNFRRLSLTFGTVAIFLALSRVALAGCVAETLSQVDPPETRYLNALGLSSYGVELQRLARGSFNQVYTVVSRHAEFPAFFPADARIPAPLREQPVDRYVLKVSEVDPALAQRDRSMLVAIQTELTNQKRYEGVKLVPTFILPQTSTTPRFIIQRRSRGVSFEVALQPFLQPALGPGPYEPGSARRLLAHILEAELAGQPLDRVFSAANLRDYQGQPVVFSPAAIKALRAGWTTDPEVIQIRDRLKKLYVLSRSFALKRANLRYRLKKGWLMNGMPWSTGRGLLPTVNPLLDFFKPVPLPGREYVNGDFGCRNFFFDHDSLGQVELEIVDF